MRTTLLRYILYTLSSLSLCVGILFYQTFYSSNTRFVGQQEVFIPSGANMEALMEVLSPYLESPRLFVWAAQMKGYSNRVRSGRYLLSSGASNQKLINRLRQKSDPVLLTFNNQERLENLAGRLAQSLESDSLSFLNAMRDTKFLAEKGFTLDNALAMYLPNSYEVFWDVSPKLFCERMYDEYKRFWTATRRNQAAQQGLSLVEVSILASIVHKETVQSAERAAVAGVERAHLATATDKGRVRLKSMQRPRPCGARAGLGAAPGGFGDPPGRVPARLVGRGGPISRRRP